LPLLNMIGGLSLSKQMHQVVVKRTFVEVETPQDECHSVRRRSASFSEGIDYDFEFHDGRLPIKMDQASNASTQWADECSEDESSVCDEDDDRTTVMLTRIPTDMTRDQMQVLLESEGFFGLFDFLYLPVDLRSLQSYGFAFVNLSSHECAERFRFHFQGFQMGMSTWEAVWSDKEQGLASHVERYRNSPVMHSNVAESARPLMFQAGERVAFPAPTKKIKSPRVRGSKRSHHLN